MTTAKSWLLTFALTGAFTGPCVRAADFELTAAELARVNAREVVVRATLDSGQRKGMVRAAVLIQAAPAIVFRQMTRCEDALQYVPHLRACRVRDQAADGSWQLVEHEVDFGWYAPRIGYIFRADLTTNRRIDFHQVSGDFKANQGMWEFEPSADGASTLLRYRAYIDPPGFVPNWVARSAFKRDMPHMLTELRRRCEAQQRAHSPASTAGR
jgi:ribosome-associated toxin RatA of RatAB toxin-antitoxin module